MPETDRPAGPPAQAQRSSWLRVVSAVSWSFFGIRKRDAMSRDVASIKPQHVILVGVALAAIMVLALVALVRFITRGS